MDGDGGIYDFNGTVTTEGSGEDTVYIFSPVSPNVPATPAIPPGTGVYAVAAGPTSIVDWKGTLTLGQNGAGHLFPSENGAFLVKKSFAALPGQESVVRYTYDYRNGDDLVGVVMYDEPNEEDAFDPIDAGSAVEVAKFVEVTSRGTFETAAAVETTYRLPITNQTIESESGSLEAYWSFDDAAEPLKGDFRRFGQPPESGGPQRTADSKVGGGALLFTGDKGLETTFIPESHLRENSPFTVMFWAKPDTITGDSLQGIIGSVNDDESEYRNFFIGIKSDSDGTRWVWGYGNDFQVDDNSTEHPTGILPAAYDDRWQHVAWQFTPNDSAEPNDDQIVIYINGREVYREGTTGDGKISNIPIAIGSLLYAKAGEQSVYQGLLDELAIFSKALTLCEIREIFNVPCNVGCGDFLAGYTLDDPVAWFPFNGNAIDESGQDKDGGTVNHPVTVIDATLSDDRFACPERAYAFNGTGAYMEVHDPDPSDTSNADVEMSDDGDENGDKDMTVAVWMRQSGGWGGEIALVQKSSASYSLHLNGNQPVFRIHFDDATTLEAVPESGSCELSTGQWHFLTGTYGTEVNGTETSTYARIYVDGIQCARPKPPAPDPGKIAGTKALGSGAAYDVGVGKDLPATGQALFSGSIDDLSIWATRLTEGEICDYYRLTSPLKKPAENIACP